MAKSSIPSQSFKSAEIVSDSDSGSDASSSSSASSSKAKRKLPSNATGTPSKKVKFSETNETKSITASEATSEASDGGGESEEEDDEAASSSGSGSTEDSSASSESDDEDNSKDSDTPQTNGHAEKSPSASGPPGLPTLTYSPPHGFTKIKYVSNIPGHASILDTASLDGKQLWHITAPASVPLADLQSLTADQIKSGSAVLSHDGARYELTHSDDGRDLGLLVPDKHGIYRQVRAEVVQHLSLKHTLPLPETALFPDDRPPVDAPTINVHDVRPARAQPEGLRTRWWPTGFEDKEGLTVKKAAAKESERPRKKTGNTNSEDTPRKKHKKDKEKSERKKRRKSHDRDVTMDDY